LSAHQPFFLSEANLALYPMGSNGTASGTAVWWGGLALGLRLQAELAGVKLAASGSPYETNHQVSERHTIEVERTWLIRKSNPGVDVQLRRNDRYVLQITWSQGGYWTQRTYYGVTFESGELRSVGTNQSIFALRLDAEYYTISGGLGGVNSFTPMPPSGGEEQLIPFFHENPFFAGDYFLGSYRWSSPVSALSARIISWAPQEAQCVVGLELNGVLTGPAVTLPIGAPNAEVSAVLDLANLTIPAGTPVRWKVVSGPSSGASAPWQGALVMAVKVYAN
jgi:hypothetical protein